MRKSHEQHAERRAKYPEAQRLQDQLDNDTVVDEDNCLRWKMGNAVPPWVWEDAFGVEMPALYLDAYNRDMAAFLDNYKRNEQGPDAEQLYEMRAAFGEGTTVVNVLTGRKTHL